MHVLFVFNHPAPYKVRLFNELSRTIKVTALFERLKNRDRNSHFYDNNEINFETVHIRGIDLGKENHFSSGIVKHLKSHRYDLVIMNGWHTFSEMMALDYLKKHRKPYVFYINGGLIKENETTLKRRIKRHYISGASWYFSPDENSNRYLIYYGTEANKIVNYPYSTIYQNEILSSSLSRQEKDILRSKLNLHHERIFVSCGQFIPRKNYERLISYWRNRPDNELLLIIGGGPQKRKYQNLIARYSLKNVKLIDFVPREQLFSYFQAADGYLFPSKEDIYGHVINEALSQGLPVISNQHVNSALRLIKDEKNGYVIDFADDTQIDMAIEGLARNGDMTSEALKTARENTIEIMAAAHLKAFNDWTTKE